MGVRVTKDFVLTQMEEGALPFWEVKEGNSILAQKQTGELAQNKTELESLLSELQGDVVTVVLRNKNKMKIREGGRDYETRTLVVALNNGGGVSGMRGNDSMVMMERIILLEKKNSELSLDAKFAELKRDLGGVGEYKDIIGMIPALIQAWRSPGGLVAPAAIAGTVDGVSDVDRLNGAIQRIATLEPQYIALIEGLAEFAERVPEQYKLYGPMLIKQAF